MDVQVLIGTVPDRVIGVDVGIKFHPACRYVYKILPMGKIQIIRLSVFSIYIVFAINLDIHYV